ncbi:MAG: RDD family protein [Candidatus Woesearchaeota archaeon]
MVKSLDKNSISVGFWKRTLAFFMDIMIINIVIISAFRNAFYKQLGNISIMDSLNMTGIVFPQKMYVMIFVISILALLYFTFFEYYLGQTLGQMIIRIRVISLKDASQKPSLWRAALRNCYVLPFFPFYIFWILEPIHLAFYKGRFLEKITATETVYESNENTKSYKEYKLEKV